MAANAAGRHIGLGTLVIGAGPEYAESLVASTLEFRGKASRGARNALDRELDNHVRINGFRDASKAPSGPLKAPILEALADDDTPLVRALLDVWSESRPDLRDAVTEYLGGDGLANGSSIANALHWSTGELDEAVHALVDGHKGLEEPDVGLMLCFVSGKCVRVDDPAGEITSPLLLDYLKELEGMDPDAPDWQDIPHFLDAVVELDVARVRRVADTAIAGVKARVEKVLGDFKEEIVYLDLYSQVSNWAEEAALKAWLIVEALPIVDELLRRLEEYRPIRPQAGTRTEEAERAPMRLAAEDAMLEVAERWRELMDRPLIEGDDDPDGLWGDDPADAEDHQLRAEVDELRGEVERLRRTDKERQAVYASVAKERADLAAERDALQAEVDRLVEDLSSSRETARIWRLARVSARMEEAGQPASEQSEPRTVRDAVTRAEKLFPDRLAVALNSKSAKRSQFQKPQEVFDALAWLAIEYYDRRANPGGSPDFDKLLKGACPGWSYKASQTEITREQFEEWYTTTWEGKTYDLSPHLGKGTSHDQQNTIRIAFAWDDERKRVVVGFIGMHQRNRKS